MLRYKAKLLLETQISIQENHENHIHWLNSQISDGFEPPKSLLEDDILRLRFKLLSREETTTVIPRFSYR